MNQSSVLEEQTTRFNDVEKELVEPETARFAGVIEENEPDWDQCREDSIREDVENNEF